MTSISEKRAVADEILAAEKEFAKVVDLAVSCWQGICTTNRALIEQKFDLGRIVHAVITGRKYGDNAVSRLADELTRKIGKRIEPKRLYEAARFFDTFHGTIDRVWELEMTLSFPVTYSFLVRKCLPGIDKSNAYNAEDLKLHIEERMKRIESAAHTIEETEEVKEIVCAAGESDEYEDDDGVDETVDYSDLRTQTAGMDAAIRQSPSIGRFRLKSHLDSLKKFLLAMNESIETNQTKLSNKELELVDDVMALLMDVAAKGKRSSDHRTETGRETRIAAVS